MVRFAVLPLAALVCVLPAGAQEAEIDAGAPDQAIAAAYEAFLGGRYDEAIALWLPLANAGDARAQYNLGVMYRNGLGVERDMGLAMAWWEKAARQLHVRAAHNMALAMLAGEPNADGKAREPDFPAVLRYLRIAADAGYPNSEYTLGKLYAEGVGVEPDPERAAALYYSAAVKGFAKAQYNLGKIYRDGDGIPEDREASIFWFQEAAERGHPRAQSKVAERFYKGEDVGKDEVAALKWAILAGRQGVESAERLRFELTNHMTDTAVAEAERLAAGFAPRKGPVEAPLGKPPAQTQ